MQLNRQAYVSTRQAVLAWCLTVIVLGCLAACLGVVLFYFLVGSPTHEVARDVRRTLLRSLWYALACSGGQVLWGLVLALAVQSVRAASIRRVLSALIITIYCLQPYVVEDIWRRILGLDTTNFDVLIAASIWQFSPFAMLFFLAAIARIDSEEPWLASLESASEARQWWQVYWPALGYTAWNLLVLRFLWMYTKFDLPFLFQEGVTSADHLISVKIGVTARDFQQACLWAGYMLVPLVAFYITSYYFSRLRHAYTVALSAKPTRILAEDAGALSRQVYILERGGRILLLLALLSYVSPLLAALVVYMPHLQTAKLEVLGGGLINIVAIGGMAALFSALAGGFLAYVGGRGHSALGSLWRFSPLLGYAVPLVLLSYFVTTLLPVIGELCRWISLLWYIPSRIFLDVGPVEFVNITSYMTLAFSAFLAFAMFSLPFTYLLLSNFISSPYQLPREQLALSDGMRGGALFQRRIVIPANASAILYALFFSFIINWQDNSVPLRLDKSGFPLFSYQLKKLAASETLGQLSLISIGILFSFILGALYFLLAPKVEALIKGSRGDTA